MTATLAPIVDIRDRMPSLPAPLMTTCHDCDGHGRIGWGGLVGPEESRFSAKCDACHGAGEVPALCDSGCGRQAIRVIETVNHCAECAAEFEQEERDGTR